MSASSISPSDDSDSSYASAYSILNAEDYANIDDHNSRDQYSDTYSEIGQTTKSTTEIVTLSSSPELINDDHDEISSPSLLRSDTRIKRRNSKFTRDPSYINDSKKTVRLPLRRRPIRQCTLRQIDGSEMDGFGKIVDDNQDKEDEQTELLSVQDIKKIHAEFADRATLALTPITKFVKTIRNPLLGSEKFHTLNDLKNAGDRCFGQIIDDCNTFVEYARCTTLMLDKLDID